MKFTLTTTLLASLILINNVEARWRPTQGMTWNYVLDSKVALPEKAKVLDVDLENTSAAHIRRYHNAGKRVICYFSGGTIENYRDDYRQYKAVKGLVRNAYVRWPDEKWLDFRKTGIKPLIIKRMRSAVNKGCDAIEVDNLDGWQQKEIMKVWSKPLTKSNTITFAKWLANTAHSLGISIGLKNSLFMINEVGPYFDFAINESCATVTHPECHLYSHFLRQGKAVFGVTYKTEMRNKNHASLCKHLKGLNISMIIKHNTDLVQSNVIFDAQKICGTRPKVYNNNNNKAKPAVKKNNTKPAVKKNNTKPAVKKNTTPAVKKPTIKNNAPRVKQNNLKPVVKNNAVHTKQNNVKPVVKNNTVRVKQNNVKPIVKNNSTTTVKPNNVKPIVKNNSTTTVKPNNVRPAVKSNPVAVKQNNVKSTVKSNPATTIKKNNVRPAIKSNSVTIKQTSVKPIVKTNPVTIKQNNVNPVVKSNTVTIKKTTTTKIPAIVRKPVTTTTVKANPVPVKPNSVKPVAKTTTVVIKKKTRTTTTPAIVRKPTTTSTVKANPVSVKPKSAMPTPSVTVAKISTTAAFQKPATTPIQKTTTTIPTVIRKPVTAVKKTTANQQ